MSGNQALCNTGIFQGVCTDTGRKQQKSKLSQFNGTIYGPNHYWPNAATSLGHGGGALLPSEKTEVLRAKAGSMKLPFPVFP